MLPPIDTVSGEYTPGEDSLLPTSCSRAWTNPSAAPPRVTPVLIPGINREATETIGPFLQYLDLVARMGGKPGPRTSVTIREIEQILLEVIDPRPDRERPIYPRIVWVVSRMIQDGLL